MMSEEVRPVSGSASLTLTTTDLLPTTDAEGHKQGRLYMADSGGARAIVRVSSNGRVHIECNTLALAIKRYRIDSAYMTQRYDSLVAANMATHHTSNTDSLTEVVRRTNAGFAGMIRYGLALLIAFVCGMLAQKYVLPIIFKKTYHIW
ncbi:hypothetical protein GCM10023093_16960 [Nemorincola caseinilytica]|uniref:Uncharacterized protein n=2 Tax=Nemorincola caseinilytica TaxID=2054315 RepID=A0ABP8NG38_9BACT